MKNLLKNHPEKNPLKNQTIGVTAIDSSLPWIWLLNLPNMIVSILKYIIFGNRIIFTRTLCYVIFVHSVCISTWTLAFGKIQAHNVFFYGVLLMAQWDAYAPPLLWMWRNFQTKGQVHKVVRNCMQNNLVSRVFMGVHAEPDILIESEPSRPFWKCFVFFSIVVYCRSTQWHYNSNRAWLP